ncbi:hypothetical protein [Oceaniovalibus sp. ACAM 378]|jgi:hypothetical protein|nr:hypothetical protein [Oceaniovalibus sp. ACAM 378]
MAIKRRWIASALEETRKPQPKMPWQARKVAVATSRIAGLMESRTTATA